MFLVFWFIWALVAVLIAEWRKIDKGLAAVAGFLLGPIGCLWVAMAEDSDALRATFWKCARSFAVIMAIIAVVGGVTWNYLRGETDARAQRIAAETRRNNDLVAAELGSHPTGDVQIAASAPEAAPSGTVDYDQAKALVAEKRRQIEERKRAEWDALKQKMEARSK